MSWITAESSGVVITLYVVPRASRNAIVGRHGQALKIRIQAPPADGQANAALLRVVADTCQIPLRHVHLLSGTTSREKRVRIEHLDPIRVRQYFSHASAHPLS